MQAPKNINRIRIEGIKASFSDDSLLLVACIREINCHETLKEIKSVAAFFGPSLNICYALDDMFPYLVKRFSIAGTPTYLLLKNGNVIDSLLGRNSAHDLVAWILSQTDI
jgi:hypothetical protein